MRLLIRWRSYRGQDNCQPWARNSLFALGQQASTNNDVPDARKIAVTAGGGFQICTGGQGPGEMCCAAYPPTRSKHLFLHESRIPNVSRLLRLYAVSPMFEESHILKRAVVPLTPTWTDVSVLQSGPVARELPMELSSHLDRLYFNCGMHVFLQDAAVVHGSRRL